jgi:hypothetical protein
VRIGTSHPIKAVARLKTVNRGDGMQMLSNGFFTIPFPVRNGTA